MRRVTAIVRSLVMLHLAASPIEAQAPPARIPISDPRPWTAIRISGDTVRFGYLVDSNRVEWSIRFIGSAANWEPVRDRLSAIDPAFDRDRDTITVAPGWQLHRDPSGGPGELRSVTDRRSYPMDAHLSRASARQILREWRLAEDESPEFFDGISTYATAANYLWVALGGRDECRRAGDEDRRSGAVVQFNMRTRTTRYLLPAQFKYCGAEHIAVAGGHLWIATPEAIVLYRIIPDTGVRPAAVEATFPRGRITAFAARDNLVAVASDSGLAVADASTGQWRILWLNEDEVADTTTRWLSSEKAAPFPDADTVGFASYVARRGVRVAMDALRLPMAQRPAFRAAAERTSAGPFVEVGLRYQERRFDDRLDAEYIAGVGEYVAQAVTDSVFLPSLAAALAQPLPDDDWSDAHRRIALDAMMAVPRAAGQRMARAILDTTTDASRGVLIAESLMEARDASGGQWLLKKLTDHDFVASDIPARRNSGLLAAAQQAEDTSFNRPLVELLLDPRLTRHLAGVVWTRAIHHPSLWIDIVRAAAKDSSLATMVMKQASVDSALRFDPQLRPTIEGLARRMIQLPRDSASRAPFGLDARWDIDVVSSAVDVVKWYRDPATIPDLVRLTQTGSFWDVAAASGALVYLTGRFDAPHMFFGDQPDLPARVGRFWNRWWATATKPFVPVSASVGAAALKRFSAKENGKE